MGWFIVSRECNKYHRMTKSSSQLKHNFLNMNGMPRNEVPRYSSLGNILAMAWCGVHDELNVTVKIRCS
ncbi:Uncharacterized protein HZ326_2007 [Fusarium oxysporum f. sp. albedinis]|nr:Uncharacterized protein HZ326_2007 [Fusarium oxysporum f. sp. albedinis]